MYLKRYNERNTHATSSSSEKSAALLLFSLEKSVRSIYDMQVWRKHSLVTLPFAGWRSGRINQTSKKPKKLENMIRKQIKTKVPLIVFGLNGNAKNLQVNIG
jgi:hypothetical protein